MSLSRTLPVSLSTASQIKELGRLLLYLTEIHADVCGDVYFHEFDKEEWVEIEREEHPADEKNEFDYSFVVLERA